jgi:hypothetical protein
MRSVLMTVVAPTARAPAAGGWAPKHGTRANNPRGEAHVAPGE